MAQLLKPAPAARIEVRVWRPPNCIWRAFRRRVAKGGYDIPEAVSFVTCYNTSWAARELSPTTIPQHACADHAPYLLLAVDAWFR